MTNEELAAAIQAGDRDKLPELWEQVRRLVYLRARRVYAALGDDRIADLDDLMQAGFFGLLEAVKRFDPSSGLKFTSYLGTTLKTAFAEATGCRTEKQRRDPMRWANSLDEPLDAEDSGSDTRGDLVADPVNQMEEVDERLYREWQREAIARALNELPAEQAQTLRLRYFEGMTQGRIAALDGVSPQLIHQRERKALRTLSRNRELREMRRYVDTRTNFFRGGHDPVTANVLWREELGERFMTR